MKALFLVDNKPAAEMLLQIASALGKRCTSTFVLFGEANVPRYSDLVDLLNRNKQRYYITSSTSKRFVGKLVDWIYPNIIIFTREETTPVEPLFLSIAKSRGIPTLLVPHGIMIENSTRTWRGGGRLNHATLLIKQGINALQKHRLTVKQLAQVSLFRLQNDLKKGVISRFDRFDNIAAYGELMRTALCSNGANPDSIVVTGNPKFDVYHDNNKLPIPKSYQNPKVLLITNYFVEFGLWTTAQRDRFVLDVQAAVDSITTVPLDIKIHPVCEDAADYFKLKRKYGLSFNLRQKDSLEKLIKGCDIAISTTSSSGMEVMACGKPLIIYNPHNDVTAFTPDSGVLYTSNGMELFRGLKKLVRYGIGAEKAALSMKFVKAQAHTQDGKATERICKLIVREGRKI